MRKLSKAASVNVLHDDGAIQDEVPNESESDWHHPRQNAVVLAREAKAYDGMPR